MTEETHPIGYAVRCPDCGGLSDALARDDGDLTCSFCRVEPEVSVVRDEDVAGRPTPGRKSLAELMTEAVERDATREARRPGAFFEGLRRAAERKAEGKRRGRTEET